MGGKRKLVWAGQQQKQKHQGRQDMPTKHRSSYYVLCLGCDCTHRSAPSRDAALLLEVTSSTPCKNRSGSYHVLQCPLSINTALQFRRGGKPKRGWFCKATPLSGVTWVFSMGLEISLGGLALRTGPLKAAPSSGFQPTLDSRFFSCTSLPPSGQAARTG